MGEAPGARGDAGGGRHPWWSVRPGVVARAVVWAGALLALGVWAWPAARQGIRHARLLQAEPPRSLPVPVEGVEPGDLRSTFGDPRGGGSRSHRGIDIFAARRTPVRSTVEGIVVRRGENPLGGRTVTVVGPGGWRHYYAHLQQYAGHSEGDWVEVGEVLGFVGTSGNAPPGAPHLHYAVYTGDGAIDPYPLMAASRDPGAAGEEPPLGLAESSPPGGA